MTIRTTIKADYYKKPIRKTFGFFKLIDMFLFYLFGYRRINYPIIFAIKEFESIGGRAAMLLLDPVKNYINWSMYMPHALSPITNRSLYNLAAWTNEGAICIGADDRCYRDFYFPKPGYNRASKHHEFCSKRSRYKYGSQREIYEAMGIVQELIKEYEITGVHVHDH